MDVSCRRPAIGRQAHLIRPGEEWHMVRDSPESRYRPFDAIIRCFMRTSNSLPATVRGRLAAGLAPWLAGIAPLMSLAHLLLEAGFNFLPVTYALLIPRLGLSYGQIGTMVLFMTIAGTVTQPLFGWLSDRGDPRLIVVASLMWGGTLMGLVGFMPTYGWLVTLVVLAALGSAAFHPPAAALSSLTEAGNRGRAMSLFSVGGNLGAALSPLLVGLALSAGGLGATAVLIPLSLMTGLLMARRLRGIGAPRFRGAGGDAPAAAGSAAALAAIVVVVGARSYFQQALMTYLIREILRNIPEHAEESTAWICGQYWGNQTAEIAIVSATFSSNIARYQKNSKECNKMQVNYICCKYNAEKTKHLYYFFTITSHNNNF